VNTTTSSAGEDAAEGSAFSVEELPQAARESITERIKIIASIFSKLTASVSFYLK